jgi:hypothetical protein
MDERFASAAGDPLVIEWHVDKHIMFTWEIDLDALSPLVPDELSLVEVRPGIALFSVAGLVYKPGNFGPDSKSFFELVSVAHVAPDLSVKMAPCRFAMHAISVYSDSPNFVRQEGEKLFTPTTLDPSLDIRFNERCDRAEASDADGPIISWQSTHPEPVYTAYEMWGQHYNDTRGLHFGIWEWDGMKFEHMKGGNAGRFHPHPFFKGMDVGAIRGCYRQMVAQPGAPAVERFYRMRQLRTA